jgi:hypothetical protein
MLTLGVGAAAGASGWATGAGGGEVVAQPANRHTDETAETIFKRLMTLLLR